jgi:hypothetical protein
MLHRHGIANIPRTGILAVRPDGYVGYAGSDTDAGELTEWLQVVCGPTWTTPQHGP